MPGRLRLSDSTEEFEFRIAVSFLAVYTINRAPKRLGNFFMTRELGRRFVASACGEHLLARLVCENRGNPHTTRLAIPARTNT
jgi:hypothetical protein